MSKLQLISHASENHFVFEFYIKTDKFQLKLTRFQSFPSEWKLETDFKIDTIGEDIISNLIDQVKSYILPFNAKWLIKILPNTKLDDPIVDFLRNLGFEKYFNKLNYALDLQNFTQKPSIPSNIDIISFSSFKMDDNREERILDVYNVEYQADYKVRETGRWDMNKPKPREFIHRFDNNDADEESIFIALHDKKPVGVTYGWQDQNKAGIYFTGVLKPYTGNGIATALKIFLARYYKQLGFESLETNNRDSNSAILKTNDKLGFQFRDNVLFMRKRIDEN